MDSFDSTLKNLVEHLQLKWIFVGGKGGVGKTTTSSSLATLFASNGKRVLIISTDPAHNLSDCFDQKFTKEPTAVVGQENLYAMEIDPTIDPDRLKLPQIEGFESDQGTKTLLSELISSVPGIDEAMSFAELMNTVDTLKYDLIVFDTAPTGHTLRLLNFPNLLEKGLAKIVSLRTNFQALTQQFSGMFGNQQEFDQQMDKLFGRVETMKETVTKVNLQMKDPVNIRQFYYFKKSKTTFVAVCIPEFLSLYETERLVQELTKYEIDIHNIIVNQIIIPGRQGNDDCRMCHARYKMQKKYIDQIYELYDDFHIVPVPQQQNEVRGIQSLKNFCQLLLTQRTLPQVQNREVQKQQLQ